MNEIDDSGQIVERRLCTRLSLSSTAKISFHDIKIADSMASRNRLQSFIKSDSYLVESSCPI